VDRAEGARVEGSTSKEVSAVSERSAAAAMGFETSEERKKRIWLALGQELQKLSLAEVKLQ